MKRIYFSEPDALEDKRLLRALEIELSERGAEITRDISDSFDAAVTFDALEIDSSVSVFYLCYETDDVPDGAIAVKRPFSIEKMADGLMRGSSDTEKSVKDEELVYENGVLSYGGNKIALSSTEASLFDILYENRGRPVSRDSIKERLWGMGESNVVDVYISYLRKKLDLTYNKKFIVTVRNKGYMLL
jgi:hypothetical protein